MTARRPCLLAPRQREHHAVLSASTGRFSSSRDPVEPKVKTGPINRDDPACASLRHTPQYPQNHQAQAESYARRQQTSATFKTEATGMATDQRRKSRTSAVDSRSFSRFESASKRRLGSTTSWGPPVCCTQIRQHRESVARFTRHAQARSSSITQSPAEMPGLRNAAHCAIRV